MSLCDAAETLKRLQILTNKFIPRRIYSSIRSYFGGV
jgi:hypothetical protein